MKAWFLCLRRFDLKIRLIRYKTAFLSYNTYLDFLEVAHSSYTVRHNVELFVVLEAA